MIYVGVSRPVNFKLASSGIMWYQGTDYSHVYIRFYDTYTNKWIVAEASHGEVHFIEFDNWSKKNIKVGERAFEIDEDHRKAVISFIIDHLQTPYSYSNILAIVFYQSFGLKINKLIDGPEAFICSELIALALDNKVSFKKPLDLVTPKDIWESIKGL